MAGDHDTETSFRKPELRGAGVYDLVHHHHGSTAVSLAGLNWGEGGVLQVLKNTKTNNKIEDLFNERPVHQNISTEVHFECISSQSLFYPGATKGP